MRILVAEDEPTSRLITKRFLEHRGHFVTVVSNGREALDAMEVFRIDAILMDIHMPIMDGFAAAREIRQREFDWDFRTPIIAYTAMTDGQEASLAAGMDAYVSKSSALAALAAALELAAVRSY